jgi:hypothetical protein
MKRGYKYNTLQQPVKIFESGARHPAASPAQWKKEEKNNENPNKNNQRRISTWLRNSQMGLLGSHKLLLN